MAHRFGFGEETGETEKGGLKQFENGHVEVSRSAFNHAIEEYPAAPPAGAVGLALAKLARVDLSEFCEVPEAETEVVREPVEIDYEALHEAVTEVNGVGEETANEVLEAVQANVNGAESEVESE